MVINYCQQLFPHNACEMGHVWSEFQPFHIPRTSPSLAAGLGRTRPDLGHHPEVVPRLSRGGPEVVPGAPEGFPPVLRTGGASSNGAGVFFDQCVGMGADLATMGASHCDFSPIRRAVLFSRTFWKGWVLLTAY